MSWMTNIFTKKATEPTRYKRSFDAAKFGRTIDITGTRNINQDLLGSLETVRDRCRQLAQNDPYIRKALTLWKQNIIGANGITLHAQSKKNNGELDDSNNETIEEGWKYWNKYGNSTLCGSLSGTLRDQLIIESVARDGEVLIVKREGEGYGKYGFQLEFIPIEQFPSTYVGLASNGNTIFQSIEVDKNLKPVAYWITDKKASNIQTTITGASIIQPTIRIPAEQCLHIFEKHYAGQMRGFPWIVTSVLSLHHLNQYKIAELEHARLASANQLFFTAPANPEGLTDEDIDQMGNISVDMVTAQAQILPQGVDIKTADWNSPNANMPDFVKTQLKGIASGLGLSYSTLANDLENINFSSAKYADLQDQATYKNKQQWFIDVFLDRVYCEWLKIQLIRGNLGSLPFSKFEKFCCVKWTCQGFRNVNLSEQAKAFSTLYGLGVMSLTDISGELGMDFDDTITQISRENKKLESLGIELIVMKDLYALDVMEDSMKDENNSESTTINKKPKRYK